MLNLAPTAPAQCSAEACRWYTRGCPKRRHSIQSSSPRRRARCRRRCLQQLALGGRLVLPLGAREQSLCLIERNARGYVESRLEMVRFRAASDGSRMNVTLQRSASSRCGWVRGRGAGRLREQAAGAGERARRAARDNRTRRRGEDGQGLLHRQEGRLPLQHRARQSARIPRTSPPGTIWTAPTALRIGQSLRIVPPDGLAAGAIAKPIAGAGRSRGQAARRCCHGPDDAAAAAAPTALKREPKGGKQPYSRAGAGHAAEEG